MTVTEKAFETYPHRRGFGKVHRYLYDSLNKRWYVVCNPKAHMHGRVVAESVTCKRCLR